MKSANKYIAILICCFVWGCSYDYGVPVVLDPDETISFSEKVLPLFQGSCTESKACHSTGGIAPDLTPANAHEQLWLYGMIDTASAEESILYKRMNAKSNPMPPSGKLPDIEVQRVLLWIKQGAENN